MPRSLFSGSDDDSTDSAVRPNRWVKLYGFQGMMPFIYGDMDSYEVSVRQLLSLRKVDKSDYILVKFDKQNLRPAAEIWGTVPESSAGAPWRHLAAAFATEDADRYALFVKKPNDITLQAWEPAISQNGLDVAKIFDVQGEYEAKPEDSRGWAYVAFPKVTESDIEANQAAGTSNTQACTVNKWMMTAWDAEEYNPYVRSALEVLAGRPEGNIHHNLFTLNFADGSANETSPLSYGGLTSGSEIINMWPLPKTQTITLMNHPLKATDIAFVLPSHNQTRTWEYTQARANSTAFFSTLEPYRMIRNMLDECIGADVASADHVRLLSGSAIFGNPAVNSAFEIQLPLTEITDASVRLFEYFKRKIIESKEPFVIIQPVWPSEQTMLYTPFNVHSSPAEVHGTGRFVGLPSTDASLEVLRQTILALQGLFPCDEAAPQLDLSKNTLSIRPVPWSLDGQSPNQNIDFPRYYIREGTTDEEWLWIRARLSTRFACLEVVPKKRLDWRSSICRSIAWGPRYGAMAPRAAAEWEDIPNVASGKPRTANCPLEGCHFEWNKTDADQLRQHFQEIHSGRHRNVCMFCTEDMHDIAVSGRLQHLRDFHYRILDGYFGFCTTCSGPEQGSVVEAGVLSNTEQQQQQQSFPLNENTYCSRCLRKVPKRATTAHRAEMKVSKPV